jgi:hypothetical protein
MRPASLTKLAGEGQMEGRFLIVPRTHHTIVVAVLEFVFFLLRMLLTFSLSISSNDEKTLILLAHRESEIHIKGLGGCRFLYDR